jgi:hypothetical protein
MTDTLETKLGEAKRVPRSRIWLQGSRLPEHGFKLGGLFRKEWKSGKLVLTAIRARGQLTNAEVGKVCGNEARPVIDIVGQKVATTFSGSHVKARFAQGQITITDL